MKLGGIILLSTEFCLVHSRRMGGAAIGFIKWVWGRVVTRLYAGASRCPQSYPSSIAHEYPIIRRPHVPGGSGSQPTHTNFRCVCMHTAGRARGPASACRHSAPFGQSELACNDTWHFLSDEKAPLLPKIGSEGIRRIKDGCLPNPFSQFFCFLLLISF